MCARSAETTLAMNEKRKRYSIDKTLSDISDFSFNMEFQSLVEKFVNSTNRDIIF